MWKLQKGHYEITGSESPISHRKLAEKIERYLYINGLMIDLRKYPYKDLNQELVTEILEKRNSLIGTYIDMINPTCIVNLPWAASGVLLFAGKYGRRRKRPKFKIFVDSVVEWGVLTPIIVAVGETKGKEYYIIHEGRHRAQTAIHLGLPKIPAFILKPWRT